MAKVVVLGLEGEKGLWAADLEAGTVSPMKADETGNMKSAIEMRNAGTSLNKGVDFAVSITTAGEAAAGLHEVAGGLHER